MNRGTKQPTELRVVFGPEIWENQSFGGISTYFAQLILGLKSQSTIEIRVLAYSVTNIELQKLSEQIQIEIIPKKSLAKYLKSNYTGSKFMIYHQTYYDAKNMLMSRYLGYKSIVTVFDLIAELFPEKKKTFSKPRINNKRWSIKLSDRVISISQATAKDLFRIYGTPRKKVETIHLASSNLSQKENERITLPKTFFLYVGKRVGYKNYSVVLHAIAKSARAGFKINLITFGGGELEQTTQKIISDLRISEEVMHFRDDEIQLYKLYKEATALIYPSHYEGFGLPILEAMSLKCPVIASDIPSTREIGQDFVTYFESNDHDELSRILIEFQTGLLPSEEARIAAQSHGASFTWAQTAIQTCGLYKSLLEVIK
jgi:glycosyltransferase involved in cell wall biosynthesis